MNTQYTTFEYIRNIEECTTEDIALINKFSVTFDIEIVINVVFKCQSENYFYNLFQVEVFG